MKYKDKSGNIYLVLPNKDETKYKGVCIINAPRKGQRKIENVYSLVDVADKNMAQQDLDWYAKDNKLEPYYDAEYRYKNKMQARCSSCEFHVESNIFASVTIPYYDFSTKRIRVIRTRKGSHYCLHTNMRDKNNNPVRLNGNHLRWYGLSPQCPFNIYSHKCRHCGQRMTTTEKYHKACANNGYY